MNSWPQPKTLAVRGLCVDLARRPVLQDIGFEARAGEVIGLIGPNGAGKTTLLRAICQLTPARAGEASWQGQRVDRMAPRARAVSLAYLPQGQLVHWPISVRRLVELGRLPRLGALSRPSPTDAAAVEAAMAAADVAHLAERDALGLSGGERARALMARALAVEAPVLLADEPTASLDPYHVLQIMGLLRRSADEGRLVVAVMHELALAARFCDRVVLLHQGRKAVEGPPREVLTRERLRAIYRVDPDALAGLDLSETG
ncbi:MAG: ABC transporter ATP-binding protein [Caulobacteraceae bacterium]|nr:ABC transporter ATP-binding protein [Caulobacteraceae bacterium]